MRSWLKLKLRMPFVPYAPRLFVLCGNFSFGVSGFSAATCGRTWKLTFVPEFPLSYDVTLVRFRVMKLFWIWAFFVTIMLRLDDSD